MTGRGGEKQLGLKRQSIYIPALGFSGVLAAGHTHVITDHTHVVADHKHVLDIVYDADPAGNLGAVALFVDEDGTLGSRLAAVLPGTSDVTEESNVTALVPDDAVLSPASATPDLASVDDGAPVGGEVNSLGFTGVLMDTAGDSISHCMRVPRTWDLSKKLGFRAYWTSGSVTAADTVTWAVTYKTVAEDAALEAASVALSTVVAEDTVGGAIAYALKITSRGVLNGGSIASAAKFLVLNAEMNAFAVGLTEDKFLLGIEIDFMPRLTDGRPLPYDIAD